MRVKHDAEAAKDSSDIQSEHKTVSPQSSSENEISKEKDEDFSNFLQKKAILVI